MNNYKLILFDLDDTLLTSENKVAASSKELIYNCSEKGILIGYVTARSPRKTGSFLEGLPCDCIAYYNGAVIIADHKIINRFEISSQTGIGLIRSIKNELPDVYVSAYFEPYCYTHDRIRMIDSKDPIDIDFSSLPPYDFQRIRIAFLHNQKYDLTKYVTDDLLVTPSVHGPVIITSNNACKKNAVNKIMEYFQINQSEILSFGDDTSDIGLFEASGTSVAMANAIQELKEIADFVTSSNNENGIAEFLNQYIRKGK